MLQVIVPLPERGADGAKLNKFTISSIEADLLDVAGAISVTHGMTQNNRCEKIPMKFYALSIEEHQLPDIERAIFRIKRLLNTFTPIHSIDLQVTEQNTITVN